MWPGSVDKTYCPFLRLIKLEHDVIHSEKSHLRLALATLLLTCHLFTSMRCVGCLVLESIRVLSLAEDGHHHRVWLHVLGLARVVPAVAHHHIVDCDCGS